MRVEGSGRRRYDAVRHRRHRRIRGPWSCRLPRRRRFRGESAGLGREQADLWHQSCHWAHRRHPTAVRPVSQGHACADRVRRHTSLLHVEDVARHIDVVGTTLDDAAGECFDKVARLLGFPYPGGPHIDRHAQSGDPHAIKVPQGLTQGKAGRQHPYDFSFSGVKTAVARWIEQRQTAGLEIPVDDVCASLADSVATVLAEKAMRGCEQYDSGTLIVGGGFSANSQLRAKLLEVGKERGVEVRVPRIKLCTDNGAMVAMLGVNLVEAGVKPSTPDFPIDSAMPLTRISM